MYSEKFSFLFFSTDPVMVREATAAGIGNIIVDLEHLGKKERQAGADTEINHYTIDDLRRVRAATDATVICRINRFNPATLSEIGQAIDAGADELLLPMVRAADEVEAVIAMVAGRAKVGILIETIDAVKRVDELARLPLARVYVGLNDLAIERGTPNIFTSVIDGTVERIRRAIRVPFGFGGLTLPDCGSPIPCRLLIAEMARLECRFSFLRRSFARDIRGREMKREVPRMLDAIERAKSRTNDEINQNRRELEEAVNDWSRRLTKGGSARHA